MQKNLDVSKLKSHGYPWHDYFTKRAMRNRTINQLHNFYSQFTATKGRSLNFQLLVSALVLVICGFILFRAVDQGLFTAHL